MIHTFKAEDIIELKKEWPAEAFGGSGNKLVVHDKGYKPLCTLKNIPPYIAETELSIEIEKQTGIKVQCRRLRYRDSNKPLPIVIATCSSFKHLELLFISRIFFHGRQVSIEAYRGKRNLPTRCYNCQTFGHVASMCTNPSRCEKCSLQHLGVCTNSTVKCYNCSGNHTAGSAKCSAFIVLKQRLESRQ